MTAVTTQLGRLCIHFGPHFDDKIKSKHSSDPGASAYRCFVDSFLFPAGSHGKESACNAGNLGLIPGSGRSPVGGNGNPLQYSCLENPTDRAAWRATVHEVTKSQTQLSDFTSLHFKACMYLFVQGFSNKEAQAGWLTRTIICFLTVLEIGSSRSR